MECWVSHMQSICHNLCALLLPLKLRFLMTTFSLLIKTKGFPGIGNMLSGLKPLIRRKSPKGGLHRAPGFVVSHRTNHTFYSLQ